MNGYQAFELMKKGGKVTLKDVGGVFYIEDGIITLTTPDGRKHFSTFNFNDEYEEIEETYTGLQALNLLMDGKAMIENCHIALIYYVSDNKVMFINSLDGKHHESKQFPINATFKLYKGDL